MSMKKAAEPDLYDIPHNYEDGGGVFGGRFRPRNAAEGIVGAGLLVYFIIKAMPVSMTIRAGVATLVGLPVFILGMFGIGNEPVTMYVYYMIRFHTSKRRLVYKRGYKRNVERTKK